jgi:hypothetical protein
LFLKSGINIDDASLNVRDDDLDKDKSILDIVKAVEKA